ncbi:hypothetical protein AB1Y20_001570 [Prymnesium parvum]|uniref:Ubiquitinyl hydrolase 1 n=1 Tax=Prymnesium parvum TaxID=97485 RepID=A0AB34K8J9_PRYPA
MADLSPWGQAVLAATSGDAETLSALLEQDASLRLQRVSAADSRFFATHFSMSIPPARLLLELALERDHEEVVLLLLEEPADPHEPRLPLVRQRTTSFDTRHEPLLRRAISELSPALIAESLRDHIAEHVRVVGSPPGLPMLSLPRGERQTFFLPRELGAMEPEARRQALGLLLEAADVAPQIERAVGWWNALLREARVELGLLPIYTSADGNCLLHACLLAALGVRDRRVARPGEDCGASAPEDASPRRLLRAAVHASLHWEPLAELLRSHGADLGALRERSARHGLSLDAAHILALAHVFGRPVVCLARGELEFRDASMPPTAAAAAGGPAAHGVPLADTCGTSFWISHDICTYPTPLPTSAATPHHRCTPSPPLQLPHTSAAPPPHLGNIPTPLLHQLSAPQRQFLSAARHLRAAPSMPL